VEIRPELDPEHKAVLADWLESRGDPRGELIAIELALEHGNVAEPAVLRARLEQLRAELEPRWIGELARKLSLTWEQLHAFMPGRWYAGLLLELAICPNAELARDDVPAVLFEWILGSDAAVALEVVDAGELPGDSTLLQLATGPVLPRVRRLILGNYRTPIGELAGLAGQLPALRSLEVRGTEITLAGFEAPALEYLRLCPCGAWEGLLQRRGLACPALTRLDLRFGQSGLVYYWREAETDPPTPGLLAGLLDGSSFPALRELNLAEFRCEDALFRALMAAPGFAGLRRLSLASLHPNDDLAPLLLEHADRLAPLDRIELPELASLRWHRSELEQALPNLLIV
jgi:hypothetical protein